jgi:aminoglycoside phosphotransferase (APT) family kinase protein
MAHARGHGYPVPEVYEWTDTDMVMDRLDGPSMLADLARHPWRLRRHARTLADLHRRLHDLPAPPGLPSAGVPGDRLLHRDLHPLNVLMPEGGPVVIDWANCAAGDPAYDVADTWVLFATAEVPGSRWDRALAAVGRRFFLRGFLKASDREAARAAIPAAVENRLTDRNMSEREKDRMRAMARKAAAAAG